MTPRFRLAAFFFLAGMLFGHAYAFWSVRQMIVAGYPDFTSFYGAGQSLRDGHGNQIYDAGEQWRTQQNFARRVRIRRGPLPYLRPPFETLLFVPFTFLSYTRAYALWVMLNLCVAAAVPFLLRPHFSGLRLPAWLLGLLPLSFTPIFFALLQGQDSILLLLLYTLAYLSLQKGAELRAGCWLALGLFKPHLVIPFVLILFFQGKKKVLLGFTGIAVVLVLISAAIVGWGGLRAYPEYIWWLEQHTGRGLVLPRDTPNLRGLVEGFLLGRTPAYVYLTLIAASSVAVVIWAAKQRFPANKRNVFELVFCHALVATFLVSYHAFAYDLSIMLLPIVLLGTRMIAIDRQPPARSDFALLAPTLILAFGPIYPLLWLEFHFMNLLALVLLLWMWGMAREISHLPATIQAASIVR
jgi:hypothetical protein